jgi:hypothetical protein
MKTSLHILAIAIIGNFCNLNAQMNSNFNLGSTHWNASGNGVETNPETVYGGSLGTNRVAEVDLLVSLTQSITGLTIGQTYTLSFRASRRTNGAAPNPVNVNINIDGAALSTTDVRSNATFGWTNSSFNFVATQTTHLLSITAGNLNITTRGFIIDDILIAPLSPLAVEFGAIQASFEQNLNRLNWSTLSERNTALFYVERSVDGLTWAKVGEVPATGNVQVETFYGFEDVQIKLNQLYYYRIVELDKDLKKTYSDMVSVLTKRNADIIAYPNPTKDVLTVRLPSNEVLNVSNIYGQSISFETIANGNGFIQIDLSKNQKGIYFINGEKIVLE